jgi:hypothetical protein
MNRLLPLTAAVLLGCAPTLQLIDVEQDAPTLLEECVTLVSVQTRDMSLECPHPHHRMLDAAIFADKIALVCSCPEEEQ